MRGPDTTSEFPLVLVIVTALLVGASGVVAPGTGASASDRTFGKSPGLASGVAQTTTPTGSESSTVGIENFSGPASVRPGENYTVTATITNSDPNLTVRQVTYRIGGNAIRSRIVAIPAGQTETVTFTIRASDTEGLPHGTYVHGVFTTDARDSSNLTITSAAETTGEGRTVGTSETNGTATSVDTESFAVSEMSSSTGVRVGDPFTVSALVSNPNEHRATQAVTLRLDGTVVDRRLITLGPGEQTRVTFTVETADLQPRDYVVSVLTRESGEVARVTIEQANQTTTGSRTRGTTTAYQRPPGDDSVSR